MTRHLVALEQWARRRLGIQVRGTVCPSCYRYHVAGIDCPACGHKR